MNNTALLALENGAVIPGRSCGAAGVTADGCLAGIASPFGLAETLTDPALAGLLPVFAYPHIGVAGVVGEDAESDAPGAGGVICAEASRATSNWRGGAPLAEWLAARGLPGMDGVDTRALARTIHRAGHPLRAVLATAKAGETLDAAALTARARALPAPDSPDWNRPAFPPPADYEWTEGWSSKAGDRLAPGITDDMLAALPPSRVAVVDLGGARRTLLRLLVSHRARVTVVAASTSPDSLLTRDFDAVIFSNGPGYPQNRPDAERLAQGLLMSGGIRLWGMGLGAGVLARACGAGTAPSPAGNFGGSGVLPADGNGQGWQATHAVRFGFDESTLAAAELSPSWRYADSGGVAGFVRADGLVRGELFSADCATGPREARLMFREFFRRK